MMDEAKQKADADLEKLNADLGRKEKAVTGNKERKKRVEVWDDALKFIGGDHWQNEGKSDKPALPLVWYVADSQVAKVFDRPVTVDVEAEEHSNYPLWAKDVFGQPIQGVPDMAHPFRQMIADNAQALEGVNPQDPQQNEKSDNEYAAAFASALVKRDWEQGKFSDKFYQAGQMAAWLGESWLLTGNDENAKNFGKPSRYLTILNPKNVGYDPDATCWEECRYFYFEVPTTLGYVKAMWPERADKVKAHQDLEGKNDVEDGFKENDPNARITLQVWLLLDETMIDVAPQVEPSEMPEAPEAPDPCDADIDEGKAPKYPSGWAITYRANNVTLQTLEDAEVMPLHRIRWYGVPGSMQSMGVYDLYKTMNVQADQHTHFALENAKKTSQNKVFANLAALQDPDSAFTNLPGGVVGVKTSVTDITQALMGVPGQPLATAHVELTRWFDEMIGRFSGVDDLQAGENLPKDASGEFLKQYRAASSQRLATIREQQIDRVAEEVGSDLLHYVMDEEGECCLRMPGDGVAKFATVKPSVLKFDDEPFEPKLRVVANGTAALPHDPIERDQYNANLLGELVQMPPELAELRLDLSAHPNKEQIRAKLQAYWEKQSGSQAQGDPQEQAKAAGQASKDFTQSMQNISKTVADLGLPKVGIELMLASIPIAQQIAAGQPVDYSGIQNVISQIPGGVPVPAATPVPSPAPQLSDIQG